MMYTYTRRNHSVEDYPHLERNSKHPDLTTEFTIHSCISIYLASEVPWTPSILQEPTNKKVLRHRTPTRVATSKNGLQSLGIIRLWEVLMKKKHRKTKEKRKKDFNYTLRRSVALMIDIRLPEYHSSQIRWWQSQNWSL